MKTIISATVEAHSITDNGDELITMTCVFPRIILSEVNTHRVFSKNTSSSRAIPYKKLVESVQNDPFIPIAWQKNHPGMQGNEYIDENKLFNLTEFISIIEDTLNNMLDKNSKDYTKLKNKIDEKIEIIDKLLKDYKFLTKTLNEWWLFARDKAVEMSAILYVFDVSKQLCNRLLETFVWTKMLITTERSGLENFFNLRCPQYTGRNNQIFKSKKDLVKDLIDNTGLFTSRPVEEYYSFIDWLQVNKGQAEIHMMQLAECMYDAFNNSVPKLLKPGQWHIPFRDKMDIDKIVKLYDLDGSKSNYQFAQETMVKISTAMAAHTSYTMVGDTPIKDYSKWIELHDNLIAYEPPHSSPMEHCSKAMTDKEYKSFYKGELEDNSRVDTIDISLYWNNQGWCNNVKGFIPYRYFIDNKIKI